MIRRDSLSLSPSLSLSASYHPELCAFPATLERAYTEVWANVMRCDAEMWLYDADSVAGMITRLRHPVSTKANKVPTSVSLGSGMDIPSGS